MRPTLFWLFPLVILLALVAMSCASRRQPRVGLANGRLRVCPGSPNCVCSEKESGPFSVEPLTFEGPADKAWKSLRQAVQRTGGRIEKHTGDYLWATYRTTLFRFVDDLECRLDGANHVIHVRSESRVGYSDFGVNRKRIDSLRSEFARVQTQTTE
jgi:uncharacterized protein (DUF1499 family)